MRPTRLLAVTMLLALTCAELSAQTRPAAAPQRQAARPFVENGFLFFDVGGQFASDELSDRVSFEANAETGTLDADYPRGSSVFVDGGLGFAVHRQIGVGFAVTHGTRSDSASVTAEVPHPFFDNRHRLVQGEATDVDRTETAVHAQLYYELQHRGPWRIRLFAGPSFFRVQQELVIGVETTETFPFDTAEFRRATTERASGTALGLNAGIDVSRMVSRRLGFGAVFRYAHANLDLNAPGDRNVSTNGGGLNAALGLRVAF